MPLITPDDTWALLAVLLSAAAFGFWAEQYTRWGARVSGVIVAIASTFALSNLNVIPVTAPVYDIVWGYVVPLAIPLLLFKADLRRIVREAGPTLVAFGCGAVGTVLGTLLAFALVPLPDDGWRLAGIFASTFIGGSVNYAGAAEALGLRSGDLLTAGVAADNLVMTLYFLVLFTLPSVAALRRWYPERHAAGAPAAVTADATDPITVPSMMTSLAIAAVCCGLGYTVASAFGWDGGGILLLTAVAVAAATTLPSRLGRLGGAQELGTVMMQLFFATIGASANIAVVARTGPSLFVFAAVILSVHLLFLLVAGAVLRLDLAEIVVASNANAGGPTTAAAMATARGWHGLVIPAILCGTLGYATATFVGVALGSRLGP
ncbi:MAG: DUF819 family protein [Vicinamibacterales bacterium]|jgi:uncharacterized membrane protein|nr:hypothetical protein [Acidobacteriota bacterium]MDP7293936.1 DUF819 family protein [Vicinamibacterales bacterium]MDP7473342.1 DUF819 family protein [Vicinamibacterales bacterium]MDP7670803.1 DUF819 family protein [Vicinamibacterales bacterium]HJO37810.1 DUF819 family protein [Vicinamibacterales bacterium]|tara:strand:- start:1017 stop:2147 length:1131 start_codon:yes stop_codon:yes gene_type:complete